MNEHTNDQHTNDHCMSDHCMSEEYMSEEYMSDQPGEEFTVLSDDLLQHPELSATAIGISAYIQSLPEGSDVSIRALAGRFTEGEVRIASALRELEAHGYLARTRVRLPSGRIVTQTVSYNVPLATHAAPQIPGQRRPQP
ncbi:hypothetical protein [Streptomyces solicavernae]|uniref:hypothetical protein n=1 Tax=Streptomyces solicavernae TaxID=3043614 RepID=UPI0032B85225